MQKCQVFVLLNKSLSVRKPRSPRKIRKFRGQASSGSRENLSSNRSPPASRPSPPRAAEVGSTRRSVRDSRFRPRLSGPGPLAPSHASGARGPELPRRGRAGCFAPENAASPPDSPTPQPRRGRSPGPRGACRWAQGAARPQEKSSAGGIAADAGIAGPGRHLPAPHGTPAPQPRSGAGELRPEA